MKKNTYEDLRQLALEISAEQLNLIGLKESDVYGVVMDWDLGQGVITLIAYNSGDASMYFGSGGGVIGGAQYESLNMASKQFVQLASSYYLDKASKTDSIPLPDKDCIRFYFLTTGGRYAIQEKMINIENESSIWIDLFEEANKVITELRLTTDKS